MERLKITLAVISILLFSSCTSELYNEESITEDNWVVEQQEGGIVEFSGNTMEITDAKGCTVWFKHKLEAPIKIQYDVTVIDNGGPRDRVSDLNCFWMSNDPENPNDFFKNSDRRGGAFLNYHYLHQYYVGYGGHHNKKTRFRRYDGNLERTLLPEHDLTDPKFMITPNKNIRIELVVDENKVSYTNNGEIVFEINDPTPYSSGYFGIRTVNNHMKI